MGWGLQGFEFWVSGEHESSDFLRSGTTVLSLRGPAVRSRPRHHPSRSFCPLAKRVATPRQFEIFTMPEGLPIALMVQTRRSDWPIHGGHLAALPRCAASLLDSIGQSPDVLSRMRHSDRAWL